MPSSWAMSWRLVCWTPRRVNSSQATAWIRALVSVGRVLAIEPPAYSLTDRTVSPCQRPFCTYLSVSKSWTWVRPVARARVRSEVCHARTDLGREHRGARAGVLAAASRLRADAGGEGARAAQDRGPFGRPV